MSSLSSPAYIMEDPREALRLECKVDAQAWVEKYLAHHLQPGFEVLSVGCGPGVILGQACSLDSSLRGTGIDISPLRIEHAIEKNRSRTHLKFVQGDAHALPFPSASFDLVYSRMLLEYLADKKRAAAEMVRVCRPGGTVLVQDLDGQLVWNFPEWPEVQAAVEKVVAGLARTGFDAFVGRKLFSLLLGAGLKSVDVQVECYHLIAGEVDPDTLKHWELKLEIAVPQMARILGGEPVAREHVRRFLEYLRRPDTLTYSNVFTVSGKKPIRHGSV